MVINAKEELIPEKVRNSYTLGSVLYRELPSLDQGGLPAGWVVGNIEPPRSFGPPLLGQGGELHWFSTPDSHY